MRSIRKSLFLLLLGAVILGLPAWWAGRSVPPAVMPATQGRSYVSEAAPFFETRPAVVVATAPVAELESAPATPVESGIVAEWSGAAPLSLRDAAERVADAAPGEIAARFTLPLKAGRQAVLLVRGFTPTASGGGVFTGELENHPGSTVVLAYQGDAVAGVAMIPAEGRSFNYRAGDDGLWRVTELDTSKAPVCGQPDTPLFPPEI